MKQLSLSSSIYHNSIQYNNKVLNKIKKKSRKFLKLIYFIQCKLSERFYGGEKRVCKPKARCSHLEKILVAFRCTQA